MLILNKNTYPNIRAILFDKDGTLIDIKSLHEPLMKRRASLIARLVNKDVEDILLKFWGIDIKNKLTDVRGPFMAASKEEEKIVAATALYSTGLDWRESLLSVEKAYDIDEQENNSLGWCKPSEQAIHFVTQASKKGYILGIATGDTTLRAIEASKVLKIDGYMKAFLGVDKVANDKPAPDLVLEFCALTNTKPNEVAILGDSVKDMKMAKNAGAGLAIAVKSGVNSHEELSPFADHIVTSFKEIAFS